MVSLTDVKEKKERKITYNNVKFELFLLSLNKNVYICRIISILYI